VYFAYIIVAAMQRGQVLGPVDDDLVCGAVDLGDRSIG
jgi:hypothetical protein